MATSGSAVSLPRENRQGKIVSSSSAPQSDSNVVSTLVTPDQIASVNVNKESAPAADTGQTVNMPVTSEQIAKLVKGNPNFAALAKLAPGISDNKDVTSANPAKTAASGDAKAAADGSWTSALRDSARCSAVAACSFRDDGGLLPTASTSTASSALWKLTSHDSQFWLLQEPRS